MNNTVSIGFDGALYQLIFFNKVPSIFARSPSRTPPGLQAPEVQGKPVEI